MTKEKFWTLIDTTRGDARDCDDQVERLEESLEKLDVKDILDFDFHFSECIRDAYRQSLWAVAWIVNGGCSDDGFDYFLGWLVAQGKEYFKRALTDPECAAASVNPGDIVEGGNIWSAAARAYERKTGKEDYYDVCKCVQRTLQEDVSWDEETVRDLYPNLAKKFK